MNFNRFNIILVILCVLIAVIGIALVEVWTNSSFKIAKLTVSIIWISLIWGLIHYVNKTNRKLKHFLNSLKYSDYVSETNSSKSFKELSLSFNEITRYVRLAELEKEGTQHYLRHVLDEIPTGVITFDDKGSVEIVNRAGLNILEVNGIKKLSELDAIEKGFYKKVLSIPKDKKKLISVNTLKGLKSILFKAKDAVINQRRITILSFENIRSELDLEEEKTWKKIFRVLTHEIMNSIGPIRSLTASVLKIFHENDYTKSKNQLTDRDLELAVTGLQSIDNRNKGLSQFVAEFKKLMRIPEPQTEKVEINQFMTEILPLLKELCVEKDINLKHHALSRDLLLTIDKEQIKQVLINLVKNSVESIDKTKGLIIINLKYENKTISIEISDTGRGIPKEILSEIFIPFFTTKKEGSGIGLSVSRQIMRNHGGDLHISSTEQKGTTCQLIFHLNKEA